MTAVAPTGWPPDRCVVIAEIAQAHNGDIALAHRYIDAVADADGDAVKFQTHIASAESTPKEPWRVDFGAPDATRYDYWRRMEFTPDGWIELKDHAHSRGMAFISSPFSAEAVELLDKVGVDAWKVASGEVTNVPLLQLLASGQRHVYLSTGMSTLAEIDRAVELITAGGSSVTVMQATSEYPSPARDIGLNMLDVYLRRYEARVGLSDHSARFETGIAAAALGASAVEVHVDLETGVPNPDAPASLRMNDFKALVDGVRWVEEVVRSPVDKDAVAGSLADVRQIFSKSIVAAEDLPAGTLVERAHLAFKKPGSGLAPDMVGRLLGARTKRALKRDEFVLEEDVEKLESRDA